MRRLSAPSTLTPKPEPTYPACTWDPFGVIARSSIPSSFRPHAAHLYGTGVTIINSVRLVLRWT